MRRAPVVLSAMTVALALTGCDLTDSVWGVRPPAMTRTSDIGTLTARPHYEIELSDAGEVTTVSHWIAGGIALTPGSGTAQFSGPYEVAWADYGDDEISVVSGTLALTANFAAGTLTGSQGGLVVNGGITGTELTGSASFNGVTSMLGGMVGSEAALGHFGITDGQSGYAGGFALTPAGP